MVYFLISLLASPLLYALMAVQKRGNIQRILVIQTAKIGDLVCTTPVFREIRRKYPQGYIAAAVNPAAAGVIENNPYIDEIIPIVSTNYKGLGGKIKLAGIFRARRFDAALILLPNLPNTLAAFWGLIPLRISICPDKAGLTFRLCSIFNSHLETHQAGGLVSQTYLRALRFLGVEATDSSPEVFAAPEAAQVVADFCQQEKVKDNLPLLGISVSCGNKLKEWGREKFAGLADLILERYAAQIIFIGAEADKKVAAEILALMKGKAINSCGRFSLGKLPALLKRIKLFIGVDTGVVYMAAAAGTPVIDIAGPCNMQDQRPQGTQCEIVQKELPCVPCSHTFSVPTQCKHGHRECLNSISIDEVMERVQKLLDGNLS